MNKLKSLVVKHPVLSVISLSILWLILIMSIAGLASVLLHQKFGSADSSLLAHLFVFLCVLFLIWKFRWLKDTGIARWGDHSTWILAIAGTTYFAIFSLYATYGRFSFSLSNLAEWPDAYDIIKTQMAVCLNEESFFRGLMLFVLLQFWGETRKGQIGSILIVSLVFALFHIMNFYSTGIAILLFVFETLIISFWWAGLVILSGSIWPAFVAHFAVNTVIGIQGISLSIVQPAVDAYIKLILFSLPLGIIALWMVLHRTGVQSSKHFPG